MKLGRRSFLRLIPAVAVAVATGSWWFFRQTARQSTVESQTATTTLEGPIFPVTWNGDQPTKVDRSAYRLKIDGDVKEPLELTLEQLYAMSNSQKMVKIICVEGWNADVVWEGVPLSLLLSRAGASVNNMDHVTIESVTGYTTTMSSDEITNPDNMIALKAGGLPLTMEHGYPARLVAPAKGGADWVKYASRITCTKKP
jgi:DMSO/TMAO reductase YedYZ molybdopterin-dependent catalytic subunit